VKNINIKLMEFFPGKTNKQISDARRRLKLATPGTPPVAPDVDALPSPAARCLVEVPDPQILPENTARVGVAEVTTSDCLQWKDAVATELRKPYEIPSTWADMAAKIVTHKELTSKEIDSLQDELARRLMANKEVVGTGTDKGSRQRKKRSSKTRPPNKVAKKRYAYAKCQKLMNKCPKKLADADWLPMICLYCKLDKRPIWRRLESCTTTSRVRLARGRIHLVEW